jgi:hypothetical protein
MKLAKKFAAADADDRDESLPSSATSNQCGCATEFDTDDAYSRADVESVRKQLSGPGWSPLVQTHERDPRSDTDIFINTADGKILGVAVISSEPRSFTIVNIIGNIDIDKLAKIEGHSASEVQQGRVIRQSLRTSVREPVHRARRIDFPAAAGA